MNTDDKTNDNAPRSPERRAFLTDVGKKTAYITPIVLTLAASPAMASPPSVSCKDTGVACTLGESCCSNTCTAGTCE
jgi:hypothetical protein